MKADELLKLAKNKSRQAENVIARGVLFDFLLHNTVEKYLPKEIGKIFEISRQGVGGDMKSVNENYAHYSFCKRCKKVVEDYPSEILDYLR